ncbi:hypothetical protein HK096_000551, partial [Nowakowskiella sp. JEL0078]
MKDMKNTEVLRGKVVVVSLLFGITVCSLGMLLLTPLMTSHKLRLEIMLPKLHTEIPKT